MEHVNSKGIKTAEAFSGSQHSVRKKKKQSKKLNNEYSAMREFIPKLLK